MDLFNLNKSVRSERVSNKTNIVRMYPVTVNRDPTTKF